MDMQMLEVYAYTYTYIQPHALTQCDYYE